VVTYAMIAKTQVIPMLAEACPSFRSITEPLYVALGDFAQHLLELQRRHDTATFTAVARAIERLHTEGEPDVKEAATIGLLEAIQNVWRNGGVDPEHFTAHLLPESRRWWDELNAFWRGERRYVGEGLRHEKDGD
jgi:hypothetical protein